MQRVVDYALIAGNEPETLTKLVRREMKKGWVPSGTVVRYKEQLIQAMVKFEEIWLTVLQKLSGCDGH